jgi:hypothetical protein
MDPNRRATDDEVEIVDTTEPPLDTSRELSITQQPDGDLVINDAALGDWSTNPDWQAATPDDE